MNGRYLAVATLVGGLVFFVWGFVTHAAVPWDGTAFELMKEGDPRIATLRTVAPENGTYVDMEGVLLTVDRVPGVKSKEALMGQTLAAQALLDLLSALLIAILVAGLGSMGFWGKVYLAGGVVGALTALQATIPWSVWWNFHSGWTLLETLDTAVGPVLVAAAVAGLHGKLGGGATPPA